MGFISILMDFNGHYCRRFCLPGVMRPETEKEIRKHNNAYARDYRKRNNEHMRLIAQINYHIKREKKLIAAGINGTMFLNVLIEKKNKLLKNETGRCQHNN